MLIGELSRNSGLSRDTIRWYEKIGLISRDTSKRDTNNYRVYGQDALDQLVLIKQSKSFGFSLKEIKNMLELVAAENLNCETVTPIIDSNLKSIDEKISQLQSIRMRLVEMKEKCTGDCRDQMIGSASSN